MQTLNDEAVGADHSTLEVTRETLREYFGVHFDLWLFDGFWVKAIGDGCDAWHGDQPTYLDFARERAARAQCFPLTEAESLLILPLKKLAGRPCAAAARFANSQADLAVRLAHQYQRNLATEDEMVQLRYEQEGFLRQVTNDFEELTFLRSMANLLEISDLTIDLTGLGKAMLPTLKPLVDSDSIVLVPALGSMTPATPLQARCIWHGTQIMSDESCLSLVEHFREAAGARPIVKNHFDRTPEGRDYPGLHSFIMVQIVSGKVSIGWLLAFNRNNERNLNVERLPWELSYLEFGTHEATLMSSSAAILATHTRNVQLLREREELLVDVVRALVSAVEAKDEYTCGHSERVALFGKCIAEEMGCDAKYCEKLYLTGLLHDVGKIGVRDAVLRKPGPLTDEEFEEIKQHPDMGWQIIQELAALQYVLNGILHHHEQFDGRGYPDRLAGLDIPLDGRILAVADAYDAMTSDRPYRKGMPHEKAESILRSGAGKQWDADIITAFFECLPKILEIKANYRPRTPRQRKERSPALADR